MQMHNIGTVEHSNLIQKIYPYISDKFEDMTFYLFQDMV